MKPHIKQALIEKLMDSDKLKMGAFPVIKVLSKILSTHHPNVDFDIVDNGPILSMRPVGWDNILKHSGLKRFDFYLDSKVSNFLFEKNHLIEKDSCKWSRGYKYPTIGSVIYRLQNQSSNRQIPKPQLIAEIIDKFYLN